MSGGVRVTISALLLAFVLTPGSVSAQVPLPIFDAHIHYSSDAWETYDVDQAVASLDESNIKVALVSSTPDDGTLKLHARAPERVVPILRPYRNRGDMGGWSQDPAIVDYVRGRLAAAPPGVKYRGLGELHLYGESALTPVIAELAQIAVEQDLFWHAHSDQQAIELLLSRYPGSKVIWAHAGMSVAPRDLSALLDRYPTRLWLELALRYDVGYEGRVDPEWLALFERYPDRVMFGTDTWITPQWTALPRLMSRAQQWMSALPRDLAERIAWRNAACLFGSEATALKPPPECQAAATPLPLCRSARVARSSPIDLRESHSMSTLKELLRSGKTVVGTTAGPHVDPSLGDAGYDFVLFDTQHSPWEVKQLQPAVQAMRGKKATPIIRVSDNRADEICYALDVGARGIVVPMVNTKEEAAALVRSCRYYPLGNRSNAGIRGEWGEFKEYRAYLDAVNEGLVIVPMIETNQAIENLDAILSVDGIDVLLVGPSDLSIELGVPLDYPSDTYQRGLDKIAAACKNHGVVPGMFFIPPGMDPNFYVAKGFKFFTMPWAPWAREGIQKGLESIKR